MKHNNQYIIRRLKLLPKQGKDISTSASNAKSELENLLRTLSAGGASIAEPFRIATGAMLDLQTATNANLVGTEKLIGSIQRLNKGFLENIDSITKLFQRNNELIKTYGITEKAAQDFGYELDELSSSTGFGRIELEKYVKNLHGLTGGFIVSDKGGQKLNKSLINQQRYLTDLVGVSDAAAESIMEMNAGIASRGVGKDDKVTADMLEKQLVARANEAKAIENITGLKGVQRTIDEEIASAGSEVSLQYSRYPKQLSIAVMKAKSLGLSMEQLSKTGDELLNIESSVSNELEYQLLSGKRLTDENGKSLTNAYRQATLQGDMNKQADIMKNILDSQGDVLENNMMARKQLAKTLGVEEGTMAKMVQKRKLLKSMGAEKLFDLTGAALEKELKNLNVGREDIAKIMEQDDTRDTQTRMAESLQNIETKGILVKYSTKADFTKAYTDSQTDIKSSMAGYENAIINNTKSLMNLYASMTQAVGNYQILQKATSTTQTEMTTLAASVPVLGTKFTEFGTLLTSWMSGITGGELNDMTVGTINSMTVGSAGTGTSTVPDGVMINDGFVKFNPRDKFTRVNDGMTVAGTNVGGIDRFAAQMEKRDSKFEQTMTRLISSMAAQMKQALESANLKVEMDRTFSSTTLNKGRYA